MAARDGCKELLFRMAIEKSTPEIAGRDNSAGGSGDSNKSKQVSLKTQVVLTHHVQSE